MASAQESVAAATRSLQKLAVFLLLLVALVCGHILLFHLRSVMVPFVLSTLVIIAVEPTVDALYERFAGLTTPYRWFCCCCHRRRKQGYRDEEADDPDRRVLEPLRGGSDDDPICEGAARCASVSIAICLILFVVTLLAGSLLAGALHLRESWQSYSSGATNLVEWLQATTRNLSTRLRLSDDADVRLNGFYTSLLDKGQALVSSVVEAIIAEVSSCVVSLIIIFLYVIFGLLYPLPIGGKVSNLVRSYLWKKTVVSLLYGFSVSALFLLLNNDLAVFFGIVSFFFNYVPEVGTIIAIFIPMPVILLDGRLLSPAATLAKATVGQLVLKIVFNNIIETSLIQNDQEMRIHPVWVLLTINYFGFIWGPAGMMIGVPILSVMKGAAVSAVELTESKDDVAKAWAESFLACLEGRPQKAREKLEMVFDAAVEWQSSVQAPEAVCPPKDCSTTA
ncbi:tqsA [Symbiodinium microadriaticum]|nr:tqsA [Symbiodinium sp. KB8]CAE7858940.1 tqsA [Symbiodinium microadriaticum]